MDTNRTVPGMMEGTGATETWSDQTVATAAGRPGQRTVAGASVMVLVPVAVVVAASYPAVVAAVVVAAIGVFALPRLAPLGVAQDDKMTG